MAVKRFSQKKRFEVGVFATALASAWGLLTGITKFLFQSQRATARQESGMGNDGPAGVTAEYQGANLTVELKEQGAIETFLAYLMRQTAATFTGWDPKSVFPAFFYANETHPETGKKVNSIFVWGAVLQGDGKEVAGQPGARQYQFDATLAREFKGAIGAEIFSGAVTPVTTLTPAETMLAWKDQGSDKYALAVLKRDANGAVTLLELDLGEYTEASGGVTLATGLGAGETAIVAYLYVDA